MFKNTVKMELEEEQAIEVYTKNTQLDQPTGPIPLIPPVTKKRKVPSLSKMLGELQPNVTILHCHHQMR